MEEAQSLKCNRYTTLQVVLLPSSVKSNVTYASLFGSQYIAIASNIRITTTTTTTNTASAPAATTTTTTNIAAAAVVTRGENGMIQ